MNRQIAEQIIPMLMRASAEVAATLEIVESHASEEQTRTYAKAAGEVVLAIDTVMRPIIIEHPDLHP